MATRRSGAGDPRLSLLNNVLSGRMPVTARRTGNGDARYGDTLSGEKDRRASNNTPGFGIRIQPAEPIAW